MPLPLPPPPEVAAAFAAAGAEFRIPVSYLQAVAHKESRYIAGIVNDSGFVGLMQIHPRWLAGFRRATGESVAAEDLKNPRTNARVGAWMLRRIAAAWAALHPDSLLEDWADPRWVRLIAFGYGAGWSERGGVARVVDWLEERGLPREEITIEAVQAGAAAAGAVDHVSDADRMRWAIATADGYFDLEGIEAPPAAPPFVLPGGDAGVLQESAGRRAQAARSALSTTELSAAQSSS